MTNRVDWFFGRGLSIGCGLHWSVPDEWVELGRPTLVSRIVEAIRLEMSKPEIDASDIRKFLAFIAAGTNEPWQHQFHTTNWDFLLQREISTLDLQVQPTWLANTHVYHLNGTVEDLPDNQNRSPIVLETDSAQDRTWSIESEVAFSKIMWNTTFVMVGISFECEVDKFILTSLNRVQDDLPIGDSTWILINPNSSALRDSSVRIQAALPCAKLITVKSTFGKWLSLGMPELACLGIVAAVPST